MTAFIYRTLCPTEDRVWEYPLTRKVPEKVQHINPTENYTTTKENKVEQ